MMRVLICGICVAWLLAAQDSPELAIAKSMDLEIQKLKDLPDTARADAIKDLALRIRQESPKFAIALASNLAQDASGGSDQETIQEVATTLAGAMRTAPAEYKNENDYLKLAGLARYHGAEVSLDHSQYAAAMAKLASNDQQRAEADFTLSDLQGRKWNLKSLRGKVVLVNFWATWCPPCIRELPDLRELHRRFHRQGLVILTISDEKIATLKRFVAERKIGYTVLLDPGKNVAARFLVDGIPQNFVYDREGRLVKQAPHQPMLSQFLEIFRAAGL